MQSRWGWRVKKTRIAATASSCQHVLAELPCSGVAFDIMCTFSIFAQKIEIQTAVSLKSRRTLTVTRK